MTQMDQSIQKLSTISPGRNGVNDMTRPTLKLGGFYQSHFGGLEQMVKFGGYHHMGNHSSSSDPFPCRDSCTQIEVVT